MVVNVAIILLIAAVAWTVIASIIEHRLSLSEGNGMPTARERTLLALFRNAALIVIVTLTVLVVLSQIGVDIAPLIAGRSAEHTSEIQSLLRISYAACCLKKKN